MKRAALAALIGTWLLPGVALACPVCFSATEANRGAYLGTTIFLSLLPLAVIGSILVFLRVRSKQAPILPNEDARTALDQSDP